MGIQAKFAGPGGAAKIKELHSFIIDAIKERRVGRWKIAELRDHSVEGASQRRRSGSLLPPTKIVRVRGFGVRGVVIGLMGLGDASGGEQVERARERRGTCSRRGGVKKVEAGRGVREVVWLGPTG